MKKYPIEITEKRTVNRITVKQSFTDFLDAFNVERGLIFTVKLLFTQPGKLIRFYLADGRYKIVNAFRLLIITTAVSLVLLNLTNTFSHLYTTQGSTDQQTEQLSQLMNSLFTDWYNLILWLSIPCYALASFLLLKKYERLNYAEHLVIQSFFISLSNILVIICLPFGYFIGVEVAFLSSFVIGVFYYVFLFHDIYKQRRFWFFFRALLSFCLANLLYFIFFALVLTVVMFNYMT